MMANSVGILSSLILVTIGLGHCKPSGRALSKRDVMGYLGTENIDSVSDFDIATTVQINEIHNSRRSVNLPKKEVKFNAFGNDFHLKLQLNIDLFPSSLVIEKIGVNGSTLHTPTSADCHYIGYSEKHNSSVAAISTCQGINGYINTGDQDYLIRRLLPKHVEKLRLRRSSDEFGGHIIFKFDAINHCSVENSEDVYEGEVSPSPSSETFKNNTFRYEEQTGGEKHLELLVLVDYEMFRYHGERTEEYVTLILNMFASLYRHPSLGVSMITHVTHLVIVTDPTFGPALSTDARASLDRFCTWQRTRYNVDSAAVLTRHDIAGSSSSTIGYASISSTCNEYRRCSLSEDTGLGLAFTLAHEVGHNLGMSHDGTGNTCQTGVNIMSPSTPSGAGSFKWSSCSANFLQEFLSSRSATCLDDVPGNEEDLSLPGKRLPGQVYDPKVQCQFSFPDSSGECEWRSSNCEALWCATSASYCRTRNTPMLDGSTCGTNMWCIEGLCIPADSGGGGGGGGGDTVTFSWAIVFSSCSRTCGNGIQVANIICRSDIKDIQVADVNCNIITKPIQPGDRSCYLQSCPTRWSTGSWSDCSTDCGTGFQTRSVQCLSTVRVGSEDPIAESECDAANKPVSSRSCTGELCPSWKIGDWSACSVVCGGGFQTREVFCAMQTNGQQKILPDSDCTNFKPDTTQSCIGSDCSTALWKIGNWGTCSSTCGYGVQTREVECIRNGVPSSDTYCSSDAKPILSRICFVTCRSASWLTSIWGPCSANCQQRRYVICVENNYIVPDSECQDDKPDVYQKCQTNACSSNVWVFGQYECSVTCGEGQETRDVTCRPDSTSSVILDPIQCPFATKPPTTQRCVRSPCPTSGVSCGGQLTQSAGIFSSPGYPNNYPPNSRCTTQIRVTPGKRIRITFNFVFIEYDFNCRRDFIEVSSGSLSKRYCGLIYNLRWTSQTNEATVTFNSNANYEYTGFRASYFQID
ncbi:A disintegrin and metalloproteinase with thrombospondin motifs 16-like [Anneissia japonica]|uniref:A disintegrin and metalloproteinase with thrombospondin motifs 16-like n=1 Tax=Anneissia japonica TaxID=1529436 RepID=UPI001425742A|nr:A disintegrin and metalloproteinase with thrombospondin motifs 16-like [Anneissia japonica]